MNAALVQDVSSLKPSPLNWVFLLETSGVLVTIASYNRQVYHKQRNVCDVIAGVLLSLISFTRSILYHVDLFKQHQTILEWLLHATYVKLELRKSVEYWLRYQVNTV